MGWHNQLTNYPRLLQDIWPNVLELSHSNLWLCVYAVFAAYNYFNVQWCDIDQRASVDETQINDEPLPPCTYSYRIDNEQFAIASHVLSSHRRVVCMCISSSGMLTTRHSMALTVCKIVVSNQLISVTYTPWAWSSVRKSSWKRSVNEQNKNRGKFTRLRADATRWWMIVCSLCWDILINFAVPSCVREHRA